MKLVIILSIAALVACDYSAPEQEPTPSNAYAAPEKAQTAEGNLAYLDAGNSFLKFKNFYQGAFPPSRLPPTDFSSSFPSFNPYKAFNYAAAPQGIFPPISQIVPPQISQIIPPIFGNAKPAFPAPIAPSQTFPPQILPPLSKPLLSKFTFPYYSPSYQFPQLFPSAFSPFPPTSFFPSLPQKQPAKNQPESLSTSYGPPASTPVGTDTAGSPDASAPFEPSPVSFPYEPAAPEPQEGTGPHKPAQEYGLPPSK